MTMNPTDRIQSLVTAGKVSPAEGERLLATLAPARPRRSLPWLAIDPFDRVGGGIGVVVGAVATGACVALAPYAVHYDGFLDCHVSTGHAVRLASALVEQGIDWLLPALLFWGYARAMSRHVRLIDFVGFIGVARVVAIAQGLATFLLTPDALAALPRITPSLMLVAVIGLALFGWQMALLFFGFKNASNLTGAKLGGGFVALVVAAEVTTKLALMLAR